MKRYGVGPVPTFDLHVVSSEVLDAYYGGRVTASCKLNMTGRDEKMAPTKDELQAQLDALSSQMAEVRKALSDKDKHGADIYDNETVIRFRLTKKRVKPGTGTRTITMDASKASIERLEDSPRNMYREYEYGNTTRLGDRPGMFRVEAKEFQLREIEEELEEVTYTFVAVKADGKWYLTGKAGNKARTWEQLVDFAKDAEKIDVLYRPGDSV